MPADQRLDAFDALGLCVELRLVVQHEFLPVERPSQLAFQLEPLGDPLGHLLRVEKVALAARLGFFQGGLGVPEQGIGIGAVVRIDRNSRFRRNPEVAVRYPERLGEVFAEPLLVEPRHLFFDFQAPQDDYEMVTAYAGKPCRVPRNAAKPCGELLEQLVAGLPAERVVDGLETLDVQNDHRELAFITACSAHGLGQALVEQIAVRKARERIVVSEVVQLFFLFDVIERKRDVAGKFLKELHLLVVEEAQLPCVKPQDSHGFTREQQRQECNRVDAPLAARSNHGRLRIVLDVVRKDRRTLPDRAGREPLPAFHVLPHGERSLLEKIAHLARRRGRADQVRILVYRADPSHDKSAIFHCDPARSLEQLVAVAHSHDQGVDAAQNSVYAVQAPDLVLGLLVLGDVLGDACDAVGPAFRVGNREGPVSDPAY